MSKKIEDLDAPLQKPAASAIADMKTDATLKSLGVTGIFISETRRDLAVQMAYYSRSRMGVDDVKKMYAAAGLYRISDAEAKTANTKTLSSKHILGRAIDIVPEIEGTVAWRAPKEVWQRIGEIGKKYGFEWGGDWKEFQDYPHFQM